MHRFMSGKRFKAPKSSIDRIFVFFHMRSLNRKALLVAAIGFMVAGCLHLLNAWVSDLPQGIHHTADDPSYLAPVENWLAHGTLEKKTHRGSPFPSKPPPGGASPGGHPPPVGGILGGFFWGLWGAGGPRWVFFSGGPSATQFST